MHSSTPSTSAPQMEPSAGGIFTMRSLLLMPRPQVALQTSHSPHSVTKQLLGAKGKNAKDNSTQQHSKPTGLLTFNLQYELIHLAGHVWTEKCDAREGKGKTHSIPCWPHSCQSLLWALCRMSHHQGTASHNAPGNVCPSRRTSYTETRWSTLTSCRWRHLKSQRTKRLMLASFRRGLWFW